MRLTTEDAPAILHKAQSVACNVRHHDTQKLLGGLSMPHSYIILWTGGKQLWRPTVESKGELKEEGLHKFTSIGSSFFFLRVSIQSLWLPQVAERSISLTMERPRPLQHCYDLLQWVLVWSQCSPNCRSVQLLSRHRTAARLHAGSLMSPLPPTELSCYKLSVNHD